MEKEAGPSFGRMAVQIMPTIEAERPPQPSWPGTYQCSSPSLGRSLHILAHLGLCSAQKRVVILLRFLSFLIWRKKKFKVLTHEFDDAWLIFFSVTKIFRRNHSSLSMCFTSSLDFAQWAFEFEFPALEIPYSKFKKVVISKCFFAVSYTIFTQYFTLLSLLCAHLICTYYT